MGVRDLRSVAVRSVDVRRHPRSAVSAVGAEAAAKILVSGAAVVAVIVIGEPARVCAFGAAGAKEDAAAACAHALRGGGGGGGGGGGLHRYSHRAAQLEVEQNKREHRAAGCECGRHSYLSGARLERDASLVLATSAEVVQAGSLYIRGSLAFRSAFPNEVKSNQVKSRTQAHYCTGKKTPGGGMRDTQGTHGVTGTQRTHGAHGSHRRTLLNCTYKPFVRCGGALHHLPTQCI